MKPKDVLRRVFICCAYLATTTVAIAQSNPQYLELPIGTGRGQALKAALYSPDSGSPAVGVLIMHRTANSLGNLACTELSKRGFLVLCINPRSENNEASVNWEETALDVKAGVEFLRARTDIAKVLLWGFSAGGGVMSFYQAVAEQGPTFCQQGKLVACTDGVARLPPADAVVLVDSNPGAATTLIRLNAAVANDAQIIDDSERPNVNAALDAYDPRNGYNPDGASAYTQEFKDRYFAAQATRMNGLIDLALAKRRAVAGGSARFTDDEVFVVYGASTALLGLDPSIHHSTIRPQKLLKNDGEIVHQVIDSLLPPQPRSVQNDMTLERGALLLTVGSFLSTHAIRSTDSMGGVDWCSSNHSVPCALQNISAPILISAMQASGLLRFNEMHFEFARSKDKDFVVIEGANHGQTPCVACEQTPGQYSNTVRNFYDYVGDWINERFGPRGPATLGVGTSVR